jgi:hypothetical protein
VKPVRRGMLSGWLCVVLFAGWAAYAQDRCNVEIKILLSPDETPAAVAALKLKNETAGRVYFFDTSDLDLLAHGLIIRLRQGSDGDLTIKVRPSAGTKTVAPSDIGEGFDCEVDLIGGVRTPSYTVRTRYAARRLPETGSDVLKLLDAEQEKLLKQAQTSVDWGRVKRIADIQATTWQTKSQPGFSKLTLEFWEWSGGKILEVSTKVGPDAATSANAELQQLLKAKGLSLNTVQQAKTRMVLESLTPAAPR